VTLRLVALVSGGGRTVLNLLDKIDAGELDARVVRTIASRSDCAAIDRLAARGIDVQVSAGRRDMSPALYGAQTWPMIEEVGADLVCLAGFLRMLPVEDGWMGRMLNIHPGLLPEYGGRGMYGDRVHEAVLKNGAKESGCTVHVADDEYDHGPILVQRRVPVLEGDDVDRLAARVFEAECEAYPEAIRLYIDGRIHIDGGRVTITPAVNTEASHNTKDS